MEARALRHCWAHSVGLCCRIPFSPEVVNYTYDLRVTVQLPAVDMKLSGPHHPLVRPWRFVREGNAAEKNVQRLIEEDSSSDLFPNLCT